MDEYVYNGKLVRKTGRVASKQGKPSGRRNTGPAVDLTLYEVESVDDVVKWKEWVRLQDLYVVHPTDSNTNTSETLDIIIDNGLIKEYATLLKDISNESE